MPEQQNTELLYILTDCVAVTVKGPTSHPSFPGVDFKERESSLNITCDGPFERSLAGEAICVNHQNIGRGVFEEFNLCPIFFEQQRYELIIEALGEHDIEFRHENYSVRKNITPVGRDRRLLSGVINFGSDIGLSDLCILVDGNIYLKITIEVFPSKISYKDDYKAIVADVTKEVYNLVFEFLKKTYDSFGISDKRQSSPVEFFAIIRKIYDQFIDSADMVIARPHHLLKTEYTVQPGHKVKRTDNKTIRWIEHHPDQAIKTEKGVKANKALAVQKHVTYDTKENRLTKYILQMTAKRLDLFRERYLKLNRDSDKNVIIEIADMGRDIQRRLNSGFFREVSAMPSDTGMSLVFAMAPGYRELYRCYLLLQHGLSVTGDIFNTSVKDLAVLYEYWCFIKLNSLMKERYQLSRQDIIKTSGNGLFVSLIKGRDSEVEYLNPENGEKIILSYNPKEINGPTVPQRPDNVLKLEKKGSETAYEYVFDAKYRINAATEGSLYQQTYGTPGPQEDDINTMHRYRDAIVYQNGASPYERTMFGAYVLFPYNNAEEYRNHRFFKSIEQINIGGLPFLPSETQIVGEMLDELVSDSPASAFERTTLPKGIEKKLAKVDWDKRDVLIGFVRDDNQFERCLEGKYYYTYLNKVSSDNLPVYYVALYRKGIGIEYYGKVLTTQETQRDSMPGYTKNPKKMCWKFNVKKWIKLPEPIRSQSLGPDPINYTNLFLLTHSQTYPELLIRSEAEYRFFCELKRRSSEAAIDEKSETSGFDLNGYKVLFVNGKIKLIENGVFMTDCDISEFVQKPGAMFRQFRKYMDPLK